MPLYVYQLSSGKGCATCKAGFEVLQKLSDLPIRHCPHCCATVRKKTGVPSLIGSTPSLERENLEKHGFTQYRKLEKGVYEKTAGKGPALIGDED